MNVRPHDESVTAARVDVLIPTCSRPAALAVTLTTLCSQSFRDFRVVVSDQTETGDRPLESGEVQAVTRLLRAHGHTVELNSHLPNRGMAEQRQFLLDRAHADHVLYLDEDLLLEPFVLEQMYTVMQKEQCGFVGSAVIGLSYNHDVRLHQQHVQFWDGPVRPEQVEPESDAWKRHQLHSAANLWHVQQRLGLTPRQTRTYRVAWVGACVMFDAHKLRDAGGFAFWSSLPDRHCGEDVLAQLRVMAKFGGCGIMPSGVFHQELKTTIQDRAVDAPRILDVHSERPAARVENKGQVLVPSSMGDLLDRVSILEIKRERMEDPAKLAHVQKELDGLRAALQPVDAAGGELLRLANELKRVNSVLWDVEDDIRACEAAGDFGPRFIALARSVYMTNDQRAALKRQINERVGSALVEEKSYAPYQQPGSPGSGAWR